MSDPIMKQITTYHILKRVGPAHWIEVIQTSRTKKSALLMAKAVAESGCEVRVEKEVSKRGLVAAFNDGVPA